MLKEYKGFYVDEQCNIYNAKGHKLSPYIGVDGYVHITRSENNKKYRYRVHTIIANVFVPNPNGFKYVNHIDSNKLNNSPENLEWCTNSQNVYHGWHSGNRTHKNRTKVSVYLNGKLINTYPSIRQLSIDLQLDRHKVARILKGESNNCYKYKFAYA
jgi:hypothetical protein